MKPSIVVLGEEAQQALQQQRPVVALESSVLAQGLPAPHNLACVQRCTLAVREGGAVPAITAVIAGQLKAGLSDDEVAQLLDPANAVRKVGARDLAPAMVARAYGATTVSATCAIADAAGIALFATGGIGGVHREAERSFDISQDLGAIARAHVAVVTAGAKAILDLPRTLEALESLGVLVVGFGTNELPAFYTNKSGLTLEHRVDTPAEAAALLRARWQDLAQGGVVIANPVPHEAEADPRTIARAIDAALTSARGQRISGKALTPFLLAEVSRRTGGASIETNLALLEHNARVAGYIAAAYR